MTRDDARACLTNGGRKTTEDEINRFLEEVKAGVPIMPVTFVCSFLEEWARVHGEPHPEDRDNPENKSRLYLENTSRREFSDMAAKVFLQIRKSNLLARRIYGGEPLRTRRCPVHKGRWSGCTLPEDSGCGGACMSGSNVTGWLPETEQKR